MIGGVEALKNFSILTILLTCLVLLIVGSNTQKERFNEMKPNHGGIVVGYNL